MLKLNLHEFKKHISKYLSLLEKDDKIILCKRNIPIAEITPVIRTPQKRPLGLAKDIFHLPESFFGKVYS